MIKLNWQLLFFFHNVYLLWWLGEMQADVDAVIQRCLSGAEAAALPQKAVKIVASSIAAVSIIIQELGLLKKLRTQLAL